MRNLFTQPQAHSNRGAESSRIEIAASHTQNALLCRRLSHRRFGADSGRIRRLVALPSSIAFITKMFSFTLTSGGER